MFYFDRECSVSLYSRGDNLISVLPVGCTASLVMVGTESAIDISTLWIFPVISCLPSMIISWTVVSSVATVTTVPGFRLPLGDTQDTASQAHQDLE